MKKSQILVLIGTVTLIVVLYSLPTYVVENDRIETSENFTNSSASEPESVKPLHIANLNREQRLVVSSLKEKIKSGISKKNVNFADSLARLYLSIGHFDSVAILAQNIVSAKDIRLASELYFDAAQSTVNVDWQVQFNRKATEYLQRYTDQNPEDLALKAKLALTLVQSSNPMQGVMMLRQILDADKDNLEALFYLGILSVQSGQFDKAVDRLTKLLSLEPNHHLGAFHLAMAYRGLGHNAKAKEVLINLRSVDDQDILRMVDELLLEIE